MDLSRIACRLTAFAILCIAALTAFPQSTNGPVPESDFNGMRWRLIGPFRAGRVVAVAGIPGNSTTFYFGSVDGGIWKTTDAGTVWKPVFDGQTIASIGAIAIAPSDPNVIYAGTGESDIRSDLASGDGVYKSTDRGKSWKNIGLRDSRQISRIVIDPANANIVYVGVLGHAYGPSAERGVYKSSDGGATWQHVLDKGEDIGISDMAIAADKPNILFAATWNAHRPPWSTYAPLEGPGGGLYRSADDGITWKQLKANGLPGGKWGRSGVAVSPDGTRVYAVIDDQEDSGLYRSDDGGDTWRRVNDDPRLTNRGWYFNRITLDPNDPNTVYVPNVALYRSMDGGKTITIVRGAPGGDDYHALWIDPKDSSRMVLGTDQGTTISLDNGSTWTTWYNQPTGQFYHVITDNQFPYAVYGAQQDSGSAAVYSRTDHGQITARDWFLPGSSESGYIALDPNHPEIIYLTDTDGAVIRFNRKTSFSQNIAPWPAADTGSGILGKKYRDPWTPVLVFSPDYKALYLGTQYVMKTTDGGLHWQTISPDLTGARDQTALASSVILEDAKQHGYGVVFSIAPSPLDSREIWTGSDTGMIHLTLDNGKTWNDVTPRGLPVWSKISMIEASRFNAGVAYVAVDRHRLDDEHPYIYRTQDYGKTWKQIADGISPSAYVHVIREDPERRGLYYAGTELGVYVSFDQGDHWQPLQLNLPVCSIRDMQVHGDDLVAATHGRAFWILDDLTPLRQAAAAMQAKNTYLYRPEKTIRIDNDDFPGTPLPPEEPTAENPPDGAVLDYVLKSPAKEVTLTVIDPKDRVIRHFSSNDNVSPMPTMVAIAERWFPEPQKLSTAPGMHRFVWDLSWIGSGARFAEAPGEDTGIPHGPRAAPGEYRIRLNVDGQQSIQPLTVMMDPRSGATQTTLQEQQETGLRIYADTERSRKAMAEIQSVQKELGDLQLEFDHRANLSVDVEQLKHSMQAIVNGDSKTQGLQEANANLAAVLSAVESGDRAMPAQVLELYQQTREDMNARVDEWDKLKQTQLKQLNRELEKEKITPVQISRIEEEIVYQMTR